MVHLHKQNYAACKSRINTFFLQINNQIHKQYSPPLLNSLHSGVLLLQSHLVWYEQQLMVANVSKLMLGGYCCVTDVTKQFAGI